MSEVLVADLAEFPVTSAGRTVALLVLIQLVDCVEGIRLQSLGRVVSAKPRRAFPGPFPSLRADTVVGHEKDRVGLVSLEVDAD